MSTDVKDIINKGPMSRFQIAAVAICFGLNMLDGFDVLVIAFTASSIAREWGASGTDIGILISMGLLGMTFGSLLIAPMADFFGRRTIILLSLVLATVGMGLSSIAPDLFQLRIYRFVTGLGIGGILASMNVITAEYSSDRWRNTSITIMTSGYGVGATIGGAITGMLIAIYDWRAAYVFGACCSAVLIPVVAWRLPESLDFLINKRPPNALEKVNVLLKRMGRELLDRLPEPSVDEVKANTGFNSLFNKQIFWSTILIWLAFFFLLSNVYFVLSWTPTLFEEMGASTSQGIQGGVLLNIGGIVGGLVFAVLTTKVPLRVLTCGFLVFGAICIALIGFLIDQYSLALISAIFTGAFMTGAMAGFYAFTPALYPPAVRATGMGWAIGIGRCGSMISPALVGWLLDNGMAVSHLYYLFAGVLILSIISLSAIRASGGVPSSR